MDMGNEEASLSEAHRRCFGIGDEQAVAFNKEQRVVIAGHDVTPQARQSVSPEFGLIVVRSSDGVPIHQVVAECDANLSWARVGNSRVESHFEWVC